MKHNYQTPETNQYRVRLEENFLASADNVSINTTYLDGYTEDEFWD